MLVIAEKFQRHHCGPCCEIVRGSVPCSVVASHAIGDPCPLLRSSLLARCGDEAFHPGFAVPVLES